MAAVIGPSSYRPGQTMAWKADGRECDNCDNVAQHAVVGETDSMGSEILHLCQECYTQLQNAIVEKQKEIRPCQICGDVTEGVQLFRDPEEGRTGILYQTCPRCRQRLTEAFCDDGTLDDDRDFDRDDDYALGEEDDPDNGHDIDDDDPELELPSEPFREN